MTARTSRTRRTKFVERKTHAIVGKEASEQQVIDYATTLWGAGDGDDDDDDAGCSGVREDGAIEGNGKGALTTMKTTRVACYDATSVESFDFYDDLFLTDSVDVLKGRGREEENLRRNTASESSKVVEVRYCSSCKHRLPVLMHFQPRRKTCVSCLLYHKRYARRARKKKVRRGTHATTNQKLLVSIDVTNNNQ